MNVTSILISTQVDVSVCDTYIGDIEEITVDNNQINYNSSNQVICATSG